MFAQQQEQRKVKWENKEIRGETIKCCRKSNNSKMDHLCPSSDGSVIKGISR